MDRLTRARMGFPAKKAQEEDRDARKRVEETEFLLESPAWQHAKRELREGYILALQKAPVTDDLLRMRLVEAIKVIDMVENHIKRVHSDADFNLNKVIKKDFAGKRGFLR